MSRPSSYTQKEYELYLLEQVSELEVGKQFLRTIEVERDKARSKIESGKLMLTADKIENTVSYWLGKLNTLNSLLDVPREAKETLQQLSERRF